MKADLHPQDYRTVAFVDLASGETFLIGSTMQASETVTIKGTEYPKVSVEVSSSSHPFYTGADRSLDATGRVERFKQRAAKKK